MTEGWVKRGRERQRQRDRQRETGQKYFSKNLDFIYLFLFKIVKFNFHLCCQKKIENRMIKFYITTNIVSES